MRGNPSSHRRGRLHIALSIAVALGVLTAHDAEAQRGDAWSNDASDSDYIVHTATGELCPAPTRDRFVYIFDARTGHFSPYDDSGHPVGGQRLSLCIVSPDWRDVFDVTVNVQRTERSEREEPIEVRWHTDQDPAQEVTSAARGETAAVETWQPSEAQQLMFRRLSDTLATVESRRWQLIRLVQRTMDAEHLDQEAVDRFRNLLDEIVHPHVPRVEGAPPGAPCATYDVVTMGVGPDESLCSLVQYINYMYLPEGIDYVDGRVIVTRSDVNAMPEEQRAVVTQVMSRIDGAIRWLLETARFAQQVASRLSEPQRIFDLGEMPENTRVRITIERRRQDLRTTSRGTLQVSWTTETSNYAINIHDTTYFRVEPGFLLSPLRRPEFSVGNNDLGDRVVRLDSEGQTILYPTVNLSFYWCGVDVRQSPFRRRCSADHRPAWRRIAPLLPSIMIGIPLTETLTQGTGSIFVGLTLDWIPFVTIVAGAHVAFRVQSLAAGLRVGDPVSSFVDDASITRDRVQLAPFIGVTISAAAFRAWTGFKADE